MSPRPASSAVSASVAVVGLIVAMGVVPPAQAEPCTGAAATALPPPTAQEVPDDSSRGLSGLVPRGHRPSNANDNAPLPALGKLIIGAIKSATVQNQAAVAPTPNPTTDAKPTKQAPKPAAATPPVPPAPPGTTVVGWVTGMDAPGNTLQRFGISGTDLGIMWDNGDPANNQVLMAFGDTYGYCGVEKHQWRYNTLFRSQDRSLAHSISVADGSVNDPYSGSPQWRPGLSKEVVRSIKWAPDEQGVIPTAGISVGRTQLMNFMSIKSWDSNGRWTTNFSGIAVSNDNGQHWGVYPGTIRTPTPDSLSQVGYTPGNENFQQGAFLKTGDGYVYSFGTPSGRAGSAYVSRVPQSQVPDLTKYQYWNADNAAWVPANPAAATPVIPGPVGEMSVQYNTYLKQFLTLYCNTIGDVVMRTAPAPQGPWGPEQMLVSNAQMPGGVYAPYLHPWSTGRELYYNLSLWSAYNVMLMHTVLP
ncbi:MAG TPA: DUF4185 domain-containing protein [Mycobacterium sp.]|nr:DUF4185 domain-containing protein [Mycobacterium sp.]